MNDGAQSKIAWKVVANCAQSNNCTESDIDCVNNNTLQRAAGVSHAQFNNEIRYFFGSQVR